VKKGAATKSVKVKAVAIRDNRPSREAAVRGNGAGAGDNVVHLSPSLVEDVDTGPAEPPKPARKFRHDLDADALGPDQVINEEPSESFAIDFGPPHKDTWFRVDPRPDYSRVLTFAKLLAPGGNRETEYYVTVTARGLLELRDRIRHYIVQTVYEWNPLTLTYGTRLWARRLPNPSQGSADTWATTDARVAEKAKHEPVRRVIDPAVKAGARKAFERDASYPPIPEPVLDKREFIELFDLAVTEEMTIRDATHPQIVYMRTGVLAAPKATNTSDS
jgi:hypothetical protein